MEKEPKLKDYSIKIDLPVEKRKRIEQQIALLSDGNRMNYIQVTKLLDEVVEGCEGEYQTQYNKRILVSFNIIIPVSFDKKIEFIVSGLGTVRSYPDVEKHPQGLTNEEFIKKEIDSAIEYLINNHLNKAINNLRFKKGKGTDSAYYDIDVESLGGFTVLKLEVFPSKFDENFK